MDLEVNQVQAVVAEWVFVEDEDWLGVNDCGAIFAPDREMKFEIDDEDWLSAGNC